MTTVTKGRTCLDTRSPWYQDGERVVTSHAAWHHLGIRLNVVVLEEPVFFQAKWLGGQQDATLVTFRSAAGIVEVAI